MTDHCPQCSERGAIVTVVTVGALDQDPRKVLVTRQCTGDGCHFKYPVLKTENDLSEEERARWRNP